jgi:hypothetical protein
MEEALVKRKGPVPRRAEQRWERERRDEHAFLFGLDHRCFGKVERDEWDFAISMAGGNVVEAAKHVGLEVPRGTRAAATAELWASTALCSSTFPTSQAKGEAKRDRGLTSNRCTTWVPPGIGSSSTASSMLRKTYDAGVGNPIRLA